MKKVCLFLAVILFVSCSKSDDDGGSPEPQNQFVGTSWISDHPVLIIIYGKGSTSTIEFLTDNICQEIDYRASQMFGKTKITEGTYTYNGNTVTWTIDNVTTTATRSGSVLVNKGSGKMDPITYHLVK